METKELKTAKFNFNSYLINSSSITLTGKTIGSDMEFSIDPDAEFKPEKKVFILSMHVVVNDKDKNLELRLNIRGFFNYETTSFDELAPFISLNAPALLFPYIRAYISNITALSGIQPILMPTLNMQPVGKALLQKVKGMSVKI
jgi:preprotein translocase subunit SecB